MKRSLLVVVVVLFSFLAKGQTFRYSDEVEKTTDDDLVQLVANVSGYHHLLRFPVNDKPRICIFDSRLKWYTTLQLEEKVKENTDVRIIPFSDHYLLYLHVTGSTEHQLWRIDGNGKETALSASLQDVVQAELGGSTATLQLLRQNENLFLVAHNYYDSLEQIISKVVQFDNNLSVVNTRKAMFPFSRRGERLQQVDLIGQSLVVLKAIRNSSDGNLLQVIKIDLSTAEMQEKIFNSGTSVFLNPAMLYTASDSTLLVHAVVKSSPGSQGNQTALFVCRLNQTLEEKNSLRTIRLHTTGMVQEDYFWVDGSTPQWLEVKTYIRPLISYQQRLVMSGWSRFGGTDEFSPYRSLPSSFTTFQSQPMNIRFSLLSEAFAKTKDTAMNGVNEKIEFVPFVNTTFRLRNKAYAILSQTLPHNNHSLLLVSADQSGALTTTDLPVYSKYEYRLSALQTVAAENAVVIPYKHKRRLGLVKISLPQSN